MIQSHLSICILSGLIDFYANRQNMQIDRICKYVLSHDQIFLLCPPMCYCNNFMMKNTILSNQQHHQICLKKQNNQRLTQKELIKWCEQELGVKVNQATISRTLKCSSEYLCNETNLLQNPLQKFPQCIMSQT